MPHFSAAVSLLPDSLILNFYRPIFNNVVFLFAMSEFDVVCDKQARAVKNCKTAIQRHAAGLSNEGVTPPEGDNSQGSEGVGVPTPIAEEVAQPRGGDIVVQTPIPSRKGKEKVGASGVSEEVPIFDANVPEAPEDQEMVRENVMLRVLPRVLFIPRSGRRGWFNTCSRLMSDQAIIILYFGPFSFAFVRFSGEIECLMA